jgi:hypothetical protein
MIFIVMRANKAAAPLEGITVDDVVLIMDLLKEVEVQQVRLRN